MKTSVAGCVGRERRGLVNERESLERRWDGFDITRRGVSLLRAIVWPVVRRDGWERVNRWRWLSGTQDGNLSSGRAKYVDRGVNAFRVDRIEGKRRR